MSDETIPGDSSPAAKKPDPMPRERAAPAETTGPEEYPQWRVVLRRDCLGRKAGDTVGYIAAESVNGLVDAIRTDYATAAPIDAD